MNMRSGEAFADFEKPELKEAMRYLRIGAKEQLVQQVGEETLGDIYLGIEDPNLESTIREAQERGYQVRIIVEPAEASASAE